MKEITLQIQDDHYEIIKHFAELYGEPVEEYVLTAAKSAVSSSVECELQGEDIAASFGVHKRLGGEDKG